MQTIRLMWDRPRRLDSKIIESFRAWQLERLADKDKILEIYFNLAPYGGNVVGAEAAARHYFGKSAAQLNLSEACLLAGLPQSPSRLNPRVNPQAAVDRRNFVIFRMLEDGEIDSRQAETAWREKLELSRPGNRVEASHFADFVYAQSRGKFDNRTVIDTTLDPECQTAAARLSAIKAAELAGKGVSGPAVVVLSLADSSVLAYVGNATPGGSPGRLVDGVRARRQPGSLMKPFIFAILAERGGIAPSTRVYDSPQAWRDYAPRNMDREWRGVMTAGDALRQSRNVTAVKQLETLGVDALAEFMRNIGLEPGPAGLYGLSLALGAKEQSLLDLTNAYAALGRLGQWSPIRYQADRAPGTGRRVLAPGAAWLALSALAPAQSAEKPSLVWKTGTSWNQLDAWAVAMTPDIAVGVWCGRLGRGGSQWAAGGEDALPLALDIVNALSKDRTKTWPAPKGVEMRQVCAESGQTPGWHCPETVLSPVLAGNNTQSVCRLHRGAGVTVSDSRAEPAREKAVAAVRIVSPTPGATYVEMPGDANTLPLLAESPAGGELIWFANGQLLGSGSSGVALDWPLRAGSHRISVTDATGRTAAVEVRVVAK